MPQCRVVVASGFAPRWRGRIPIATKEQRESIASFTIRGHVVKEYAVQESSGRVKVMYFAGKDARWSRFGLGCRSGKVNVGAWMQGVRRQLQNGRVSGSLTGPGLTSMFARSNATPPQRGREERG